MDLGLLGLTATCPQGPWSQGSGRRELFTFETLNLCAVEASAPEAGGAHHQHPTCISQSHREIPGDASGWAKGAARARRPQLGPQNPMRFHTNRSHGGHLAARPWANLTSTSWEKEDHPQATDEKTEAQGL